MLFVSAGFGGKPKKPLEMLDVPVIILVFNSKSAISVKGGTTGTRVWCAENYNNILVKLTEKTNVRPLNNLKE